ncbi:TrkH family potassium uptake protein [Liberiplasma polymorphum]|uniref:TrkH family potassium uptake protein n=1 Tax=Liberiplasma polymorphum TaxID=3374570 RepID=UPI0037718606
MLISRFKFIVILRKFFFGTSARGFVSTYLFFMFIGASMLRLPISLQSGQSLSWLDALFTSASALSTTGLSTIVVKDTFTIFGQTVLIFIIQFGGIGLIMMVSLFWLIVRKKINFKERTMIMTDQNQLSRQGVVKFVRNVLIMIFTIELVGFILMTTYLFFAGYFPFKEAAFQAFFTTISLFTNAGFDIAPTGDSFAMFKNDYFMQTLGMSLMFMGAMGFWPLYELREFIIAKRKREKFEFSLFAKVLVGMHLLIWIISAVLFMGLEFTHFLSDKAFFEGLYYTLFMTLTTRNAGFSTMNVNDLTSATQVFFVILMFIGSSPNSAGGGIRTTTLLLVILGIRAFAIGRDQVVIKQRSIKHDTVFKSFIVIFVAGSLIAFNLILLTIFEPYSTTHLAFEVASAFGTTGLSMGITQNLTWIGKVVLIVTMFIGRIGILALVLMFKPSAGKVVNIIHYPEMDMIVG